MRQAGTYSEITLPAAHMLPDKPVGIPGDTAFLHVSNWNELDFIGEFVCFRYQPWLDLTRILKSLHQPAARLCSICQSVLFPHTGAIWMSSTCSQTIVDCRALQASQRTTPKFAQLWGALLLILTCNSILFLLVILSLTSSPEYIKIGATRVILFIV